jgi:hypothetical protein
MAAKPQQLSIAARCIVCLTVAVSLRAGAAGIISTPAEIEAWDTFCDAGVKWFVNPAMYTESSECALLHLSRCLDVGSDRCCIGTTLVA